MAGNGGYRTGNRTESSPMTNQNKGNGERQTEHKQGKRTGQGNMPNYANIEAYDEALNIPEFRQ